MSPSPDVFVMSRMYTLNTNNTPLSASPAFVNVYENKTVSSCALSLPNKEKYYCALAGDQT